VVHGRRNIAERGLGKKLEASSLHKIINMPGKSVGLDCHYPYSSAHGPSCVSRDRALHSWLMTCCREVVDRVAI
jgi:hypothetical protein